MRRRPKPFHQNKKDSSQIRLNKYISNSGICSRREADKFIEAGIVSVNGKVITKMGHKIYLDDVVKFNDATIKNQKLKYLLLNKPKNYTSSFKDSFKKNSCKFGVFLASCSSKLSKTISGGEINNPDM